MTALFSQLTIFIKITRLNNNRRFLIDELKCDNVSYNIITDNGNPDDKSSDDVKSDDEVSGNQKTVKTTWKLNNLVCLISKKKSKPEM